MSGAQVALTIGITAALTVLGTEKACKQLSYTYKHQNASTWQPLECRANCGVGAKGLLAFRAVAFGMCSVGITWEVCITVVGTITLP